MTKYAKIFTLIVIPTILAACGTSTVYIPSSTEAAKTTEPAAKQSTSPAKAAIGTSYAMCNARGFMSDNYGCINVNRVSDSKVCTGKDNEFCGEDAKSLCVQVGRKVGKSFRFIEEQGLASMEACKASCKDIGSVFDPCLGEISNS